VRHAASKQNSKLLIMKNFTTTLTLLLILLSSSLFAQVNYTAKDQVTIYNDVFLFGSNFGYNPPWQDEDLANIAAGNPALGIDGVGVKSSRPTLPGWFMEEYGYDFRLNTYQHYADLGLRDNVCIVGFPSDDQKETDQPCNGIQSEMFDNLYTDIWDGGANGTPYNDDNYYAAYLYKTVSMYKQHVKFWEIWNEPGFDYSGNCGWREPGDPLCNWWDNDPDPCINKLRAPIQHYVRTLRISWEIIKTLDPDAYVIVAGVGFPSFLDAILRNTDNPVDGSVTPEYPHGGGAYFDVMGFHSYTHFDGTMKYWDNATNQFVYERHSDKGASGVLRRQDQYQAVLDNYGFDGTTFPKKEWIITEINGPRKQFQDFVGSEEYQRNFLLKAAVVCMKSNIRAMHVYNLAERKTFNEATGEFDLFGLYKKVKDTQPYTQVKTSGGVAYKTMSDLLFGSTYDAIRTAQLNMPATIDGGAFLDVDGNHIYIMWAKTTTDMSEVSSATYSFPAGLNINYLEAKNWEYSNSFQSSQVDPNSVALTAEPIFFTESIFSTDVSAGCEPLMVNFQERYSGTPANYNWTFDGGIPATSTDANPSVNYANAGTYEFNLAVLDGSGNTLATQTSFVVVTAPPSADFTYTLSGPIIVFQNNSSTNTDTYNWFLGDGTTSSEREPTHVYDTNGTYTITMIASNGCGTSMQSKTITINTSSNFQVPFNANTVLTPYEGTFRPGTNFGYNPPWTDFSLADIAAGNPSLNIKGVGVKASRPALPGWFVNEYGYEFNLPNYQHYDNLGLEENVLIIGFPAPEERDPAYYCDGVQSEMFANMYSDIWDDGTDGTPYNDENYLAAYLYKVVTLYGDNIRFWEIWNEPGFDYTGNCGWREPGDPVCNWWDQNPDPCDFKLRAPIMHYVRILRISYEIIKTLQPDDYLVVAGVGFPSYLDAILRNTDNPVDGSATADYPLGGGAYFDVMGFHAYPHFDGTMRWWDNSIGGFHYERHSDQAITGIENRQNLYQGVLENYGYNGATYPKKEWIITESNLPRREFQDFIGNEDAQINYMAKAVVTCYKNAIHQFHVYNLGEAEFINSATREFDVMGMYQKLIGTTEYSQVVNLEGISYKTASDILFGNEYDGAKTNAMNLPSNIDGAAFIDAVGKYSYVLWAITTEDQSEVANANYSFPGSFNISDLYKREWDYSETNATQTISPNNVALTGRPIYLLESQTTIVIPTATFFPNISVGCAPLTVNFDDMSHSNIDTWNWTFTGPNGFILTSTDQDPAITFNDPGTYHATLEVSNAAGTNSTTQLIQVDAALSGGFTYVINGNQVTFTNTSVNATSYAWDFGDGVAFVNQENTTHTYAGDGLYNIGLSVINACDTIVITQVIEIGVGSGVTPTASFSTNLSAGCGPLSVNFINLSSNATNFMWTFPGGTPSTSTDQNPTVVYNTPGNYNVILAASNASGTTTFEQTSLINVLGLPSPSYTYDLTNSPTLNFANNSLNGFSYYWDFGDGNNSQLQNPIHTYSTGGAFTVTLTAANGCGSASFSQIINIDASNLPPTAGFTSDNINGCLPMEINFMDNSVGAESWNWTFSGGTPATSTDQNPSVIYDVVGTYDVILEVSNTNGTDLTSTTSYITILDIPVSSYTFTTLDSLATFTNFSSTNSFNYTWNFGDGTFSMEQNPTHTYGASGVYEVILTATNGCGSHSTTFFVDITTNSGNAPAASFTSNINAGCGPLEVQFTDLSAGSATGWNWSFPGAMPSSSTDQNPTVTYPNQGTYTVTLEASNSFGNDIATQVSYINVGGVPTSGFSSTLNALTANFSNTSTSATSYAWNFGDGNTSTAANPVHTYAIGGGYAVTLIATNDCGSTTFIDNISFVNLPVAAFNSDITSGCGPLEIQFNDNSTGATEWNWSFPGGTPATSTDENPIVTYNTPGTYNVTLVAANVSGNNTSTQTTYIEVLNEATASFASSTNALNAIFTNTSTNATSYVWNFGDGNMSTNENPTHNYAADGTYTVTLTATNACGSVTSTTTITVTTAAVASFTADVISGCTPLTVNFTDQSIGTVDSWLWEITGATPSSSTNQNPTFTFDTPGTYDVTLTATNATGDYTNTQTSYIIVTTTPIVDFDVNFSGGVYSFTNNTTGATSYSWDFDDGNMSTDMNPTHTYTTDGIFVTTLTATNDCGSVTTTQTITVTSVPVVAFTADVVAGCAPLVVNFMDLTTGTVDSWSWEITGGTPGTSTEQNPNITFNTPGTYDVTLTVTNPNGSYPITQTSMIVVAPTPTASFDANLSGSIYSFTNNSTGATSYTWDFGDGSMTSTEMNPTHSYGLSGSYTVQLISNGPCGADTTELLLAVVAAPMAAFSSDTPFGCAPFMVQFTDESANATAWSWTFDGGTPSTSTDQNPLVTYDTPGTYAVILDASNSVGSDNITVNSYIVVDDVPTATFSANSDTTHVVFLNTSIGGTNPTYLWNFGDGMTSTDETPSHDYAAGGTYIVTLTVTNDCGSETFEMTVVLTTATNEITFLEEFLLFPNPTDGQFTVVLKGEPKDDLHINLINIIGQYIHREEVDFTSGQLTKTFNFDRLPVGTYIVELKSNQQVTYKKVVIE
jgi:PKD repeat protein